MLKLRVTLLAALAMPPAAAAQWAYTNTGGGELRGLSAVNDQVVWASGARGTIVRSSDGGRTWTTDTVGKFPALDFRAIHAWSDRAAIIASAGEAERGQAAILSTADGSAWALAFFTNEKGVFLDAIAFWDTKNGVALSDPLDGAFALFSTSDGGRSWRRMNSAGFPRVLPGEAAFAASGSSLVVRGTSDLWIGTGGGGRGRVFHSPDRGASWIICDTPVHAEGGAAGIFSLAFFDARRGIAVGGDYTKRVLPAQSVALTVDGGRSWRAAKAPPAAFLSGVAYAGSPARLVAVGLAGTFVSQDSGDSWTQVDSVALNSVRFHGTSGWAAGPRGRIARWAP